MRGGYVRQRRQRSRVRAAPPAGGGEPPAPRHTAELEHVCGGDGVPKRCTARETAARSRRSSSAPASGPTAATAATAAAAATTAEPRTPTAAGGRCQSSATLTTRRARHLRTRSGARGARDVGAAPLTRVPEGRSIWSRVAVAIDVPINIEPCDDIELSSWTPSTSRPCPRSRARPRIRRTSREPRRSLRNGAGSAAPLPGRALLELASCTRAHQQCIKCMY